MTLEQANVGAWVRSLRAYCRIPEGSIGVIDDIYNGGVWVAWYGGDWMPTDNPVKNAEHHLVRDGFAHHELSNLDFIPLRRSR